MRIQSLSNAPLLVNQSSLLLSQLFQLSLELTYFSLRFTLRLYLLILYLQPPGLLLVEQNFSEVVKSLNLTTYMHSYLRQLALAAQFHLSNYYNCQRS